MISFVHLIKPYIIILDFRLKIILFFLLFLSCDRKENAVINTSIPKSDSLQLFFDQANNDSLTVENRKKYNQKALEIITNQKKDSIHRVNLFKIANRYYNMNELEEYKLICEKIVTQSISQNDSTSLAKAYSYLGDYYGKFFMSELAYKNYFNAERIYRELKLNQFVAKSIINKAVIQSNEKDFVGAEKSALDALRIVKNEINDELKFEIYNILGIIHMKLDEYDKSLEFHNKALVIAKSRNLENQNILVPTTLNNIGAILQSKSKYEESIDYFKKALSNNLLYENPSAYATIIDNIGYSKLKLKNTSQLPDLFYQAYKIRDSLNITLGIIGSNLNLSYYYAFKNDTLKSLELANNALRLSKDHAIPSEVLLSLKQLIKIDKANTIKYSEEYLKLNDSLQLAERQIRNKLARIEFETDELISEKDKLVEQRKNIIYISLTILLIGMFIYIIRFQIAKNKELKLLQEQQKANEEIYQLMMNQQDKIEQVRQLEKTKIAQDLHDGILGKLFGTRFNLEIFNNSNSEEIIAKRKMLIIELQNIEREIREISHDLSREKQEILNNFTMMLDDFIQDQKVKSKENIEYYLDPNINWSAFESSTKIDIYRIIQESFQNIHKYAQAKKIAVSFILEKKTLILHIKDDGIGFDISKKKKGIGFKNMHNRILSSHGEMKITSNIGEGTSLEFKIPINNIPN